MNILAASFSGKQNLRTVLVKSQKGSLSLISMQKMTQNELINRQKADQIILTFDYGDFTSTEVDLPPLIEQNSVEYLLKSKLKDVLAKDVNYSFVLNDYLKASSDNKRKYSVCAVPENFIKNYGVTELDDKVTLITLDTYAIAALSAKYSPKGIVCHAFADESNMVVSFSEGKNLLYSRIIPISSKLTGKDEISEFYYENINLTFMYFKQNKQKRVDTIIFSGKLFYDNDLSKRTEEFSELKVSNLDAGMFILNCSNTQFQEYLLPIASIFVNKNANFMSQAQKAQSSYNKIIKSLTSVMTIILFVCVIYFGLRIAQYQFIKSEVKGKEAFLFTEIAELNNYMKNYDYIAYNYRYIKALQKREESPLNLYTISQDLLSKEQYNFIEFTTSDDDGSLLNVQKEEAFDSYAAAYLYKNSYEELLKREGINADDKNTGIYIPEKLIKIKTEIHKGEVNE